jgi:hypothetical protein
MLGRNVASTLHSKEVKLIAAPANPSALDHVLHRAAQAEFEGAVLARVLPRLLGPAQPEPCSVGRSNREEEV